MGKLGLLGVFLLLLSVTASGAVVDSSDLSLTNYGNVIVREGNSLWIVYEKVVSASNSDIFVSFSTDGGLSFENFNLTNTTDKNEMFPSIDINATSGLIIAYDVLIDSAASTDVFVTTCSAGGCDSSSEFLSDINVSGCGVGTECSHSNIVTDVNSNSHMVYSRATSGVRYRTITGYVGGSWGAEETAISGGTVNVRDGTGILIAKTGEARKLAIVNTDNAQLRVGYFNTFQWTELQLETNGIEEAGAGFAGYDNNFYIVYTKASSGAAGAGKQIHFRQCVVTADCNVLANWSVDVNITGDGLNLELVSAFQSMDLNFHVLASSNVSAADANIFHFVRTPNNVWVTSHLGDGNLLFDDANRNYNPLVRNRDYNGSVQADPLSRLGQESNMDYVFLTSGNSDGDPSSLFFDSNILEGNNGIAANFTVTTASPFVLTPTVTNITVDFNSTSAEIGLTDVNYQWFVDGTNRSLDQNFTRDFNGGDADFNISLIVGGTDGIDSFVSQQDQNVQVINTNQDFDINFSLNRFVNNADLNIGGTRAGETDNINYIVWGGTDFDFNRLGLQIRFDYNSEGIKEVCGVFNTAGDVNNVFCESINITRALVKIPLDEETPATQLTPFSITVDGTAPQNYSSQSADLNVFIFDQNTNQFIDISVDFNTSYFIRDYGIFTDVNQLFFEIQPYLALVANSITVTWITQDLLTNETLPNIKIRSQRSIDSILTEVESPFTDLTGSAIMTFIPAIPYTLTFDLNGIIVGTGTYVPDSSDITKNAFLNISGIVYSDFIQDALDVNYSPASGVIDLNSDHDFLFSQDINVVDGNLQSLRIQIIHGSDILSDLNHSNVGTFQQLVDFSGRDFNTLVTVEVTAVISGQSFRSSKTYGITQFTSLVELFRISKEQDFGHTGGTLVAVLITTILIGGIIRFTKREGDSNSGISFLALPIMMFFGIVGWVSWIPIIFGGSLVIILYLSNASQRGGF